MSVRKLSPIKSVLILKTDLMIAEAIRRTAQAIWPKARFRIAHGLKSARAALRAAPVDLLLTGLSMLDGDVCALVKSAALVPRAARRIVIVTGRRDPRFLSLLRELPVDGAYHTQSDGLRHLPRALRMIQRGGKYFSRKFGVLMSEQDRSDTNIFQLLTDAELHALAVFGHGCDVKEAARRLKLSIKSAHSVCEVLHKKLGVHHKGELMCVAHREGVVRFTANGVECLDQHGLARRREAARRRKRG